MFGNPQNIYLPIFSYSVALIFHTRGESAHLPISLFSSHCLELCESQDSSQSKPRILCPLFPLPRHLLGVDPLSSSKETKAGRPPRSNLGFSDPHDSDLRHTLPLCIFLSPFHTLRSWVHSLGDSRPHLSSICH